MANRFRYGKRLYTIWVQMRSRCRNPKHHAFERYGGRGVSVCKDWLDYETFAQWALGHGYSDDLTIERIDVNGNYCPENCTWITRGAQARNRRSSHLIEYNGEIKSEAEWSREIGMSKHTVSRRLQKGLDMDAVMNREKMKPHSPYKAVYQFKDCVLIKKWERAGEAASANGWNTGTISYACRTGVRAYGYRWSYSPELDEKRREES